MTTKNLETIRFAAGVGGWARVSAQCSERQEAFERKCGNRSVRVLVRFDSLGRIVDAVRGFFFAGIFTGADHVKINDSEKCSRAAAWLMTL